MTDREAFEAWIVTTDINCLHVTRREAIDDDTYYLAKTHIAWLAWQAACTYRDEQWVRNALADEPTAIRHSE